MVQAVETKTIGSFAQGLSLQQLQKEIKFSIGIKRCISNFIKNLSLSISISRYGSIQAPPIKCFQYPLLEY
ncbi:hypothetical protein QYF36_001475 [Acer negundo]|nr:hypothetical protein QYF36_001475 [Acer negundo]